MNSQKDNATFEQFFTNKYWVMAIALLCSMLWGSAFPVLKISYLELNMNPADLSGKIVFAGMRFLLASIFLFLYLLLIKRNHKRIKWNVLPGLILLGIVQTSLQYFFFYNGLAHTTGIKGAILSSSGTFFVVFLAPLFYPNDKLNWKKILGLGAGFAGILLVNSGKGFVPVFSLQGEGFLLLSALTSAVGTLLAKRLSQNTEPFLLTAVQMFFGSILLLGAGLPGLQPHAMSFTPKAWLLFIYSAFLSAAAFSLWYSLLKYNKAGEISMYKFMIPVSGAIFSALTISGEHLTLSMLWALILVAAGIIIVNQNQQKEAPSHISST